MDIAIVGTGFIGGILGRALAGSGHRITFGSRHPADDNAASGTSATVASIADALDAKLVIDATNQMGQPVANAREALPPTVRYARAFNTLGGENMADPVFTDGPADMFFSAAADDRATVERVIEGVGLHPVYLGADREDLVDALFRVWIALAIEQGRGRRLALRLIEG